MIKISGGNWLFNSKACLAVRFYAFISLHGLAGIETFSRSEISSSIDAWVAGDIVVDVEEYFMKWYYKFFSKMT